MVDIIPKCRGQLPKLFPIRSHWYRSVGDWIIHEMSFVRYCASRSNGPLKGPNSAGNTGFPVIKMFLMSQKVPVQATPKMKRKIEYIFHLYEVELPISFDRKSQIIIMTSAGAKEILIPTANPAINPQ